jgi:hypothetical protein
MKILTVAGFVLIVAHAQFALGEAATAQQPKPGPEVQKLAYYLGTWTGEGEAKSGPFGPGGKLSSTTTCEWFAGGFHLVCRGEEHGPTGTRTFLNLRGYDEKTKTYTEYSISNLGESESNTGGTIVGSKRTFVFDIDADGKRTKLAMSKCRCRRHSSRTRPRRRSTAGPGRRSQRARSRRRGSRADSVPHEASKDSSTARQIAGEKHLS